MAPHLSPFAPVRRSGRQAKRTDKLEEFLSTAKRGRGGRRSAPGHLENWDPPSQTPTDGETASEASFDGNAPADERKQSRASSRKKPAKGGSVSEDGSSENEDSTETIEKGQQKGKDGDGMEPQQPEQGSTEGVEEETNVESESSEKPTVEAGDRRATGSPAQAAGKDSTPSKKDSKPKSRAKASKESRGGKDDEDDDDDEDSSGKSDNEGYDPNALYCICRQKHNKRFCTAFVTYNVQVDCCSYWFHGDCVGITEARGRLLERNGEDYICPNCTVHKSQATSPADSNKRSSRRSQQSCLPEQTAPPGGAEEKASEDLGIKGRIEKATNPSGKKKIKIFQPVATSLPKCIGPGCDKNALPDSVYCGNDCILKHAAAAMKSITDVKEPKPKEKAKLKAQRKTGARKSKDSSNKTDEAESDSEDNDEEDDGADNDDDDDDDDIGEEQRPSDHEPAISSWSSDHNYIAVTPDRAAAIASSVFNKSCMYLWEVCHTSLPHIFHTI
uniref:Zinc finger PHD-type domain-containing protein n=1 Tax=Scleropages formosus TaxID=113540 RepID=A0A8C9R5R0_SCLFO